MKKDFPKKRKLSDGIRRKDSFLGDSMPRADEVRAYDDEAYESSRESGAYAPMAEEGGVIVEQADAADYRTYGRGMVASEDDEDDDDGPAGTTRKRFFQAQERQERTRRPDLLRRSWAGRRPHLVSWGLAAGFVVAAAVALVVSTAGARMTVVVRPRVESVSLENVALHFDTAIAKVAVGDKLVPAERLALTRTLRKEFDATGSERVVERARAKVKIYNQFSSSPQPLVKDTRFLTPAGVLFRLPQGVSVPGAKIEAGKIIPQFIEAELVADLPGDGSNISGSVQLRIPGLKGSPKYDGFYALAPQGFSGGAAGTVRTASPEDITKAEEAVTKELSDAVGSEIARKVPPGLTYKDAFRDIQIIRVDAPRAHAPGDRFAVEAASSGRVLVFREGDVGQIARDIALGGDETRVVVDGSLAMEYQVRNIDFDLGRADVLARGSVKTKAIIPERELAALIAGKKEGSVAEMLRNRSELSGFTLSFSPPWRSSAPGDPANIRFRTE